MRFLMIDRICELDRGKSARGIRNVSWDDAFLEEIFPGMPVASSILISEAVAQLVSWIIVEAKDFTVKPLITVVDSYTCTGHIQPGDQLEVTGSVESFSDEGALAHGKMLLNGKPVVAFNHAVCYFYPLSELDLPERARMQFKNLYAPGCSLPRAIKPQRSLMREDVPLSKRAWLDRIVDDGQPERMVAFKNVTATEDYFNDHFPLKPILPGVIIIKCMASLSRTLLERMLAAQGLAELKPVLTKCEKVKIRKFVQPGDQLVIEAALLHFAPHKSVLSVKTTVQGKNVSAGTLEFEHISKEDYRNKYLS
ncbi:MAG: hypothetical protein WCQ99_10855 [Pseudomonadota bacterium]